MGVRPGWESRREFGRGDVQKFCDCGVPKLRREGHGGSTVSCRADVLWRLYFRGQRLDRFAMFWVFVALGECGVSRFIGTVKLPAYEANLGDSGGHQVLIC